MGLRLHKPPGSEEDRRLSDIDGADDVEDLYEGTDGPYYHGAGSRRRWSLLLSKRKMLNQ